MRENNLCLRSKRKILLLINYDAVRALNSAWCLIANRCARAVEINAGCACDARVSQARARRMRRKLTTLEREISYRYGLTPAALRQMRTAASNYEVFRYQSALMQRVGES